MTDKTLRLKQTINEAMKHINEVDKSKLDSFFMDILNLKKEVTLFSEFSYIQEFNKLLIVKKLIQKENQINFYFFFSFLIRNMSKTNPFLEIDNNEIILNENIEKSSLITNILFPENENKMEIKNIFSTEPNLVIHTFLLNKKKFNSLKFFIHSLINYKYKLKLTLSTVKHLLYIFYIFRTRIEQETSNIDKNICDYIKNMIEFLEINYYIIKKQ